MNTYVCIHIHTHVGEREEKGGLQKKRGISEKKKNVVR